MTTATGRSPGLRLSRSAPPSQALKAQWHEGTALAADSCGGSPGLSPDSLLIPLRGTRCAGGAIGRRHSDVKLELFASRIRGAVHCARDPQAQLVDRHGAKHRMEASYLSESGVRISGEDAMQQALRTEGRRHNDPVGRRIAAPELENSCGDAPEKGVDLRRQPLGVRQFDARPQI